MINAITAEQVSISEALTVYRTLAAQLATVMTGQEIAIRHLLAAFASGGHVLLEDLPGTGKTTLAKTLAQSLAIDFQRIQFTPDLLPSDILGVSIFDPRDHSFHFHPGPIFTEILLADEINRASPRAQSALLEAMAEKQVSLEGVRHPLSELFFVVATQNPIEFHGTYPLPEAQMDRFAMRFSLGYVQRTEEAKILSAQQYIQTPLTPCTNRAEMLMLRETVRHIRISEELKLYIVDLVRATRSATGVVMGASPRASLSLMKAAQALALFDEQAFITPDHIQEIAIPVLAHRLKIDTQARFSGIEGKNVIEQIVRTTPVPV